MGFLFLLYQASCGLSFSLPSRAGRELRRQVIELPFAPPSSHLPAKKWRDTEWDLGWEAASSSTVPSKWPRLPATSDSQLTAIADHLTRRVVAGNHQRLP